MKKTIFKASLLVCVLICILAFTSCQQNNGDVVIRGVEYRIYDDHCTVVDIRGIAGWRVEIPSHVEGKPVISISVDYRWFLFPDTIQARELIIPDTVKHVDSSVYEECHHLKYNEYEGGLYLGNEENPYHAFVRPKDMPKQETVEAYSLVTKDTDLPEKDTPPLPPFPQSGPNSYTCTIHPDTVIFADAAFASCTGLKSITVPGSIETVPEYLFAGARDLEAIVIEEGVKNVHHGAFSQCTSLKSVSLPESLEYFDASFDYCSSLESIEIPDCVTYLGNMFNHCQALKSVYIGEGIESIEIYAFEGCTSLEAFTVSEDNPNYASIDGDLYSKDGATLMKYAGGKADTFFEVPSHVKTLSSGAFDSAVNLVEVVIPDNVVEYDPNMMFYSCTSLETLTLGKGITVITGIMFGHDNPLKTLNVSNTVTMIKPHTLSYCTSLQCINVESGNPYYTTVDGNLYSYDKNELIKYCPGKPEAVFEVPSYVQKIGSYAFFRADNLADVKMGDTVTEIGAYAFANCKKLKDIKLSEGVTKISENMFYGCESLENVILGKNVTVIESEAFYCCGFNVKIHAPRTLQYIERDGLGYADVVFDGTKVEWQRIHERSLEKDSRYSDYQNYSVDCTDGHLFVENQ